MVRMTVERPTARRRLSFGPITPDADIYMKRVGTARESGLPGPRNRALWKVAAEWGRDWIA